MLAQISIEPKKLIYVLQNKASKQRCAGNNTQGYTEINLIRIHAL